MRTILRSLFRRLRQMHSAYIPLVEVSISREAILHNLRTYQKMIDIAPVLKSNAYGHGLVEVAKLVEKDSPNLPFFVVDSYHEALILRNEGLKTPILVIGYTATENIANSRLKNTAFTLSSLEQIKEVAKKVDRPQTYHLKIDTGMHRQGILPEELDETLRILQISYGKGIRLEGVCSHLADADNVDENFTKKQIAIWNDLVKKCLAIFPDLKWRHLSATSGVLHSGMVSANALRLGLGLYGLSTNSRVTNELGLRPALSMHTIMTSVKMLRQGESVGYDRTFIAPRDITIATLPAGYHEGIDRRLSNKGSVRVLVGSDTNRVDSGLSFICPIIGRVSMNMTVIDISAVPKELRKIGTRVEIVSAGSHTDPNSIANMANLCDTIPYELAVHVPKQLRRRVV